MFEPKTYTEQRLALTESLLSTVIGVMLDTAEAESDQQRLLMNVMDQWQYRAHEAKKLEAIRLIGRIELTDEIATHTWIESLLRANYGLLEVFGEGGFNPEPVLPGNDPAKFAAWTACLEGPHAVVRETRGSEFFFDRSLLKEGLVSLKIVTPKFLHLIALQDRVYIQTLSLEHLPAGWDWDRHEHAWKAELFSYINTLTRAEFVQGLAEAILTSRKDAWGDDVMPTLYVPETDAATVALVRAEVERLGLGYRAITLVTAQMLEEAVAAANDEDATAASDATETHEPEVTNGQS